MSKQISAFKGFNPDFTCRDHQFKVGQTYTAEGDVKLCYNGFHACENPFDVLSYYPLINEDGSFSRFASVTLSGATDRRKDDIKIAAASITIGAELRFPEFICAGVNWLIAATKGKKEDSGYSAQIGSSGYSARIGSSGNSARIGSSGDSARIGSSGYSARIGSSGYSAQIGSSGYSAQIGSSGNSARIGSSGDSARIGSSGDSARIGSSGYYAQIKCEGNRAVVASAGAGTSVSGKDGTWLSLAEYDIDGKCVGFATGCIGQDGLKPDTMYRAKGGKLVAA